MDAIASKKKKRSRPARRGVLLKTRCTRKMWMLYGQKAAQLGLEMDPARSFVQIVLGIAPRRLQRILFEMEYDTEARFGKRRDGE
jgi:hypothetical protein